MDIRRVISKARDATIHDYLSVFPMLAGLIASPFYKKKYEGAWGICERKNEARDNGYHFFKYMTSQHPEQKCIYAIDRNCNDFKKVCDLGETVQFGSVRHWILYFTCEYLISSQAFKPDGYVCTFIERVGLFHPDHVFLQHGITINKPEYLRSDMQKVKYFITATPQETEFVKNELGYGHDTVKMCGFSRFDALHNTIPIGNRILIMPTWRKWLKFQSETHEDAKNDIISSEYLIKWKDFLCDRQLKSLVEHYNLEIIFYPHPNLKEVLDTDLFVPSYINVADSKNDDIQDLMKSSRLLITDYSSVFFDMVYMGRPILFYQFDIEKFRKYHYEKGWFDYETSNYGQSHKEHSAVIADLERSIESDFSVDSKYISDLQDTFPLHDSNNSERIYLMLKGKEEEDKYEA